MTTQVLVQTPQGDKLCANHWEANNHTQLLIPLSVYTATKDHGATVYWGIIKLSRINTDQPPKKGLLQRCLSALKFESHLEETP